MADSDNAASASNEEVDLGRVFNPEVLAIVNKIDPEERDSACKKAMKLLENKTEKKGRKIFFNSKFKIFPGPKTYKLTRPDGTVVYITLTPVKYWLFVASDNKVDIAADVVIKIGQEELTTPQVLSTTPYFKTKKKHPLYLYDIPAKLRIDLCKEGFIKTECDKIQRFFTNNMYKPMVVAAVQSELLLASNSAGKQQRRLAKKASDNSNSIFSTELKMTIGLAMQNSKTIVTNNMAIVENSKAIGRVDERVTDLGGRVTGLAEQVNGHDDTIHSIQDTLQAHKRQTISDINRLSQLLGSQEMSPSNAIKASSGRGIGSPAFNFPLDRDENAGKDAISPIRRSFGPGFGGSPAFNFSPGGDELSFADDAKMAAVKAGFESLIIGHPLKGKSGIASEDLDSSSTRLKPTEPTMAQIERVQIDSAKKLSLDEADARSLDNQFEAYMNMNVLAAQKDEAQKDEERKAAAATAASTKKDEEAEAAAAAAQKDEGTKTAATAPPAADAAETVPAAGFSFGGNTTIATGSTTTATPGVTATATTPVPGFSFGTSTTTASAGLGGGGTAAAVPPSSSSTATVKDISRAQCEQLIGTSPGVTIMNTSHNRNADTTTPKSDTTSLVDQGDIPSSLDTPSPGSKVSFGLGKDTSPASSSPAAAVADLRPSGKPKAFSLCIVGSPATSGSHGKENCKPSVADDAKKPASTAVIGSRGNKLPLKGKPCLLPDSLNTIEQASVGSTTPVFLRPEPSSTTKTASLPTGHQNNTATAKEIIPSQCVELIGNSPVVTIKAGPQAGANVTLGYQGEMDMSATPSAETTIQKIFGIVMFCDPKDTDTPQNNTTSN